MAELQRCLRRMRAACAQAAAAAAAALATRDAESAAAGPAEDALCSLVQLLVARLRVRVPAYPHREISLPLIQHALQASCAVSAVDCLADVAGRVRHSRSLLACYLEETLLFLGLMLRNITATACLAWLLQLRCRATKLDAFFAPGQGGGRGTPDSSAGRGGGARCECSSSRRGGRPGVQPAGGHPRPGRAHGCCV